MQSAPRGAAHLGSIAVAMSSTKDAALPPSPPLFLADLILSWCNLG